MNVRSFPAGLYGITPETNDTVALLKAVELACQGGMKILQWRQKKLSLELALPAIEAIQRICKHYQVVFIINDDLDLALQVKADGVHIGKDDGSLMDAREKAQSIIGSQTFFIGCSCYNSLAMAQEAALAQADYIAFGALFSSRVKPEAVHAPLSLFAQAKTLFAPLNNPPKLVGIGGIDQHNAASVVHAGADNIAVISSLFNQDPYKAAQFFSQLY